MVIRSDNSIDRRTRTLILLLLVAEFSPQAVSRCIHWRAPGLDLSWQPLWFFLGVGSIVPLLAIAATSIRLLRLRICLLAIIVYASVFGVFAMVAVLGRIGSGQQSVWAYAGTVSTFLYVVAYVAIPWVFHAISRQAALTPQPPKRIAASITRRFVPLFALPQLARFAYAAAIAAQAAPGVSSLDALDTWDHLCVGTVGVLLVFAGLSIVRGQRLSRAALWWTLLLLAIDLLIPIVRRVVTMNLAIVGAAWQVCVMMATAEASVCLIAITLAWYWWPVLLHRESPTIDDTPTCLACGYNLTGNVSGRCPECGSPVATVEPETTYAR